MVQLLLLAGLGATDAQAGTILAKLDADAFGPVPIEEADAWIAKGAPGGKICDRETHDDGSYEVELCKKKNVRLSPSVVFHREDDRVYAAHIVLIGGAVRDLETATDAPRKGAQIGVNRTTRFFRTDRDGVFATKPRKDDGSFRMTYWVVKDEALWMRRHGVWTEGQHVAHTAHLVERQLWGDAALLRELTDGWQDLVVDRVLALTSADLDVLDDRPVGDAVRFLAGVHLAMGRRDTKTDAAAKRLLERVDADDELPPGTRLGYRWLLTRVLGERKPPAGVCEGFDGRYALSPAGGKQARTPVVEACEKGIETVLTRADVTPPALEAGRVPNAGFRYERRYERRHTPSELERRASDGRMLATSALSSCRDEKGLPTSSETTHVITPGSTRTYNTQSYGCNLVGCGTQVWKVTESRAAVEMTTTSWFDPCAAEEQALRDATKFTPPRTITTTVQTVKVPYEGELWRGHLTESYDLRIGEASQRITLDEHLEKTYEFELVGANTFYLKRNREQLQAQGEDARHDAHLVALRARIETDLAEGSLASEAREEERRWRNWLYAEGPAPFAVLPESDLGETSRTSWKAPGTLYKGTYEPAIRLGDHVVVFHANEPVGTVYPAGKSLSFSISKAPFSSIGDVSASGGLMAQRGNDDAVRVFDVSGHPRDWTALANVPAAEPRGFGPSDQVLLKRADGYAWFDAEGRNAGAVDVPGELWASKRAGQVWSALEGQLRLVDVASGEVQVSLPVSPKRVSERADGLLVAVDGAVYHVGSGELLEAEDRPDAHFVGHDLYWTSNHGLVRQRGGVDRWTYLLNPALDPDL